MTLTFGSTVILTIFLSIIRPNKKKSVFRVTGPIIRHNFFTGKNIILYFLKGISPFKMHKIIFLSRKPEKNLGSTSKFR